MGGLPEKSALSREVGREIAKDKVNYKKEMGKQLERGDDSRAAWQGLISVVCINLQADESKQDISIKRVLDAELATAIISFFARFESCDFPRIMEDVFSELEQAIS